MTETRSLHAAELEAAEETRPQLETREGAGDEGAESDEGIDGEHAEVQWAMQIGRQLKNWKPAVATRRPVKTRRRTTG